MEGSRGTLEARSRREEPNRFWGEAYAGGCSEGHHLNREPVGPASMRRVKSIVNCLRSRFDVLWFLQGVVHHTV
jgi:hypothetical protein